MSSKNPTHLFSLIGVLLLGLGLALPWVRLADVSVRQGHLRQLLALLDHRELPEWLQDELAVKGIKPGMTTNELWQTLGRGEHAADFLYIQKREQLHAWQFLVMGNTGGVKAAVVATGALWLAATLFLVVPALSHSRKPKELSTEWEISAWDQTSEQTNRKRYSRWHAPPLPATLLVLILFLLQLPYLDTLGYSGEWQMGLFDALTGARVTFAPRVLVLAGVLCLMLAGVEDWLNWINRGKRRQSKQDDIFSPQEDYP